jgi:hypothetical protein
LNTLPLRNRIYHIYKWQERQTHSIGNTNNTNSDTLTANKTESRWQPT